MTEPPYKRARRPDSKQMWDESDRRALIPSREGDDRRDDRDSGRGGRDRERERDRGGRDRYADREKDRGARDADKERDRRYRCRSPGERGGRDRDHGGRQDEHDTRHRDRGGRYRDEGRDGERGGRGDRGEYRAGSGILCYRTREESNGLQVNGRDSRAQGRVRSRDRRHTRSRSRSPRKERDVASEKKVEQEKPLLKPAEEEFTKSRTATPPVSFKVGRATSHEVLDHDRMETDEDPKPTKKTKSAAKAKRVRTPEPENDDDIVIEDDGMAAMQAMMGFGGFNTTQNKKVIGNDVSAVRKEKKTEYRQYMNRVGGFNRPLSPSHEG